MSQIIKKFIGNDQVDGTKIKLQNDQYIRARNAADDGDVNVIKVDANDKILLASLPQSAGTPSAANDLVNKSYVDSVIEGLKPKEAVRAASTADLTLSGEQTVDGVALSAGDRILVKNQAAPEDNGIYVVAAGAWSRALDFDSLTPIDEINGSYVAVQEGTANQGKLYVQSGTVATLGTDAINFVFFNSAAFITGGDGIDFTANVISVDHDGEGLTFVSNQLALELDGATLSKSASGLKVADLGVDTAQLADDSVTKAKINADVAGLGLSQALDGSLDVNVDDSTIEIDTDTLRVKDAGITEAKLASDAVTKAKIADDAVGEAELDLAEVDADTFVLSAAYSPVTGTVTIGDTIEEAIEKIVFAQNNALNSTAEKETFTLIGADITNQYIDLSNVADTDSISFLVAGAPVQIEDTDYTVSYTGGAGGNTRITFAGDLATAGAAALEAGDVIQVKYTYQA